MVLSLTKPLAEAAAADRQALAELQRRVQEMERAHALVQGELRAIDSLQREGARARDEMARVHVDAINLRNTSNAGLARGKTLAEMQAK